MGELETLRTNFEQKLREHKGKYIFQGMMFIVLGIAAGSSPVTTALSMELLIGAALLITGAFQMVLTFKSRMHWWSLFSALLSISIGTVMVWKPLAGLLAVVTLLAIFMTLEGIFELLLAWRFKPIHNWNWMFFSGIVTLVLAALLWIGFPAFDVLYLSWVIAINFIFYGISLMMLVWRVAA